MNLYLRPLSSPPLAYPPLSHLDPSGVQRGAAGQVKRTETKRETQPVYVNGRPELIL